MTDNLSFPSPIKCCILGKSGKMASHIANKLALKPDQFTCHQVDSRNLYDIETWLAKCADAAEQHIPVIIDFTHPDCTKKILQHLANYNGVNLVIGTSGIEHLLSLMKSTSNSIAIFQAANFSLGAVIQNYITSILGRISCEYANAAILDFHHEKKLDSISATARALQSNWQQSTGKEAPIASIRLGDAISEHTLYLSLPGERLELAHRLLHRDAFMQTLAYAIRFISSQKSGNYSMQNLFNFLQST